jgi:hypothetical protein
VGETIWILRLDSAPDQQRSATKWEHFSEIVRDRCSIPDHAPGYADTDESACHVFPNPASIEFPNPASIEPKSIRIRKKMVE